MLKVTLVFIVQVLLHIVKYLLSYLSVHLNSCLLLLGLFSTNQLVQLFLLLVDILLVILLDLFYHFLVLLLDLVVTNLLAVLILLADHLFVLLELSFGCLLALFRDLLTFLRNYLYFFRLPKSSLDLKLSFFICNFGL